MTDAQRETLRALSASRAAYSLNRWERHFVANLLMLDANPRKVFVPTPRQAATLADLAARLLPPPQPPPDPSTE